MDIVIDGAKFFATTGGKDFLPIRRPIVFLHGAAMDHTVWTPMARWFAHRGRSVLVPDLPAHGRSSGSLAHTVSALSTWLWRLLDGLHIESHVTLVGHSLGSLVALEAAAARPSAVARLALLGCAVPMRVNADFLNAAERNDPKAIRLMNDWSHSRRAHLGGNESPGFWMVGADTRLTEQAAPGVLYHGLKLCNDYSVDQGHAAAARVICPTLFVVGEQDQMTPPSRSAAFVEKFTNGHLCRLKNCGHIMMAERPNETLDALIAFL